MGQAMAGHFVSEPGDDKLGNDQFVDGSRAQALDEPARTEAGRSQTGRTEPRGTDMAERDGPIFVASWDARSGEPRLAIPESPDGPTYRSARVLVTEGVDPLGFVTVPIDTSSGSPSIDMATAASPLVGYWSTDEPTRQGPARPTLPAENERRSATAVISVIITTNNRPAELSEVLRGIDAQTRRPDEVIIVDNGGVDRRSQLPLDAITLPVRYVQAAPIGMCFSRNVGTRRAKGDLLVYLTDDAIPAPHWLAELLVGMDRPGVGAAYGSTVPLRLENPGQILFEQAFNWSAKQGLEPRLLQPVGASTDPLSPYRLSDFPAGAQMGLWRDWYDKIGGFDDAIGAGTLVRGGDDLDITSRLLIAGARVALQPSALAWHDDDTTMESLPNKMYAYGTGLFGFLMKHLVDSSSRTILLKRIPTGVRLAVTAPWNVDGIASIEPAEVTIPRPLMARHFWGRVSGPFLYLRSRRRTAETLKNLSASDLAGTELESA